MQCRLKTVEDNRHLMKTNKTKVPELKQSAQKAFIKLLVLFP